MVTESLLPKASHFKVTAYFLSMFCLGKRTQRLIWLAIVQEVSFSSVACSFVCALHESLLCQTAPRGMRVQLAFLSVLGLSTEVVTTGKTRRKDRHIGKLANTRGQTDCLTECLTDRQTDKGDANRSRGPSKLHMSTCWSVSQTAS